MMIPQIDVIKKRFSERFVTRRKIISANFAIGKIVNAERPRNTLRRKSRKMMLRELKSFENFWLIMTMKKMIRNIIGQEFTLLKYVLAVIVNNQKWSSAVT